ncbi:MAG: FAD binding domain-containing protein [Gemmatimonadota bacterium]|nr:MAG: FAD binding domain-containing protein [Gemmatimonadota bacterium]
MAEAVALLETSRDGVLLAGGTDLLVDLKQGKRFHEDVISLTRIEELHSIELHGDSLVIGAAVTHNQLIHSPLIRQSCFAISEAAATIGTEQIRNTATVGGNLCTAASCADTAPILIALEARVELIGGRGRRTLALANLFVDHRRTALEKCEILSRIIVPVPPAGTGAAFEKFGLRQAANISVASVAVMVRVVDQRCERASFVMGAVAPTPRISGKAAGLVEGRPVSQVSEGSELLERVARAVADDAAPLDDIRGSAAFRREVTATLARRAFEKALSRAVTGVAEGQAGR